MMASASAATATAHQLTTSRCRSNAAHFGTKSAGKEPTRRPSRSFTWLEKMISAMPLVNPMVTGYGMNLIAPPRRARPRPIRSTPAMIVAMVSPATP